jgi:hypothetical protein
MAWCRTAYNGIYRAIDPGAMVRQSSHPTGLQPVGLAATASTSPLPCCLVIERQMPSGRSGRAS